MAPKAFSYVHQICDCGNKTSYTHQGGKPHDENKYRTSDAHLCPDPQMTRIYLSHVKVCDEEEIEERRQLTDCGINKNALR